MVVVKDSADSVDTPSGSGSPSPDRGSRKLSRPARIGQTSLVVLACLAAPILMIPFDVAATTFVQDLASDGTVLQRSLRLPAHIFEWYSFVALGFVVFIYPRRWRQFVCRAIRSRPAALFTHRRRWQALVGFCLTLTICFGCLHAVKTLVGRARPDLDLGPRYLKPLGSPRLGYDSFPSGHAATSMLLAALAGLYFPRSRWFLVPAAVLVCLGRIALDRHFLSDVVGGAGLALLSVYLSVRLLGRRFYPRLAISELWPLGKLPK